MALGACGGGDDALESGEDESTTAASGGELTVGGATFTEMAIMQEIYRLLLERYALKAERTVFVDDRAENVAGAEAVGMIGILFEGALPLRESLNRLGLLERDSLR